MTTRKRPAPAQDRPSPNHTRYSESIAIPGHDRVEPLDAEDRADLAVLEAAAERGYRLATKCVHCGHWVSHPISVRLHAGPHCRSKAVGE